MKVVIRGSGVRHLRDLRHDRDARCVPSQCHAACASAKASTRMSLLEYLLDAILQPASFAGALL